MIYLSKIISILAKSASDLIKTSRTDACIPQWQQQKSDTICPQSQMDETLVYMYMVSGKANQFWIGRLYTLFSGMYDYIPFYLAIKFFHSLSLVLMQAIAALPHKPLS